MSGTELPSEDEQLHRLRDAFEVIDLWESLTGNLSGSWKTSPGSDLASDDAATYPYPASGASWAAITAAVSHLSCLKRSIFHTQGVNRVLAVLQTHGPFTLIRGALENASMAIWLMASDQHVDRVIRRFQQEWEEVRHLETVREIVGSQANRTMEDRLARLSDLATNAGADPRQIKNRPGYGDIVRAAAADLPMGSDFAFLIWKACSAIAHGEMRAMLAYLQTETLGETSPGMNLGRVTSNVQLLVTGGLLAIGTTKAALNLYRRRAGGTWPDPRMG